MTYTSSVASSSTNYIHHHAEHKDDLRDLKVLRREDGGGVDEKWVRSDIVSGLLKIWGQ